MRMALSRARYPRRGARQHDLKGWTGRPRRRAMVFAAGTSSCATASSRFGATSKPNASEIAARLCEACDEASLYRVITGAEDNENRCGCCFGRERRSSG
jgi:hypothetical protein